MSMSNTTENDVPKMMQEDDDMEDCYCYETRMGFLYEAHGIDSERPVLR
jgi:hypothetical protein